jgi:hypothetical protein
LCEKGLLVLIRPSVWKFAAEYQLHADCAKLYTYYPPQCKEVITYAHHDVFRYCGLGKSGAQIWIALRENGASSVSELVRITGRHRTTIARRLKQMSRIVDQITGEIVSMVEFDGITWHAIDVNLDEVAWILGTAGMGRKQREKHRKQQIEYKDYLDSIKQKGV